MPDPRKQFLPSPEAQQKPDILLTPKNPEHFDGILFGAGRRCDPMSPKKTLRKSNIPAPTFLKPDQIAGIRSALNVSQAVFASYLGVSKAAVIAWEYGSRRPSGAALKLLAIAQRYPQALLE